MTNYLDENPQEAKNAAYYRRQVKKLEEEVQLLKLEESRANQLNENCMWLIRCIEEVHANICPNQYGTWQMQAQQIVEASKRFVDTAQQTKI